VQPLWLLPAAVLAVLWLWFLARGRSPGAVKRIALRATLLLMAGGLVGIAAQRGVFSRASFGFRLALLLSILIVTVGYLYLTRFCNACGRMVRNMKIKACPRCGTPLPVHGMTARMPRESGDGVRPRAGERRAGAARPRYPEGPSA
jgi:hypothetical protein